MSQIKKTSRTPFALSGLVLSLSLSAVAQAAGGPSGFSYEGRLYDSSGNPSVANVQLTLSIYNPAGNCLLHSEQSASIDLSTTSGYFSVTVGQGTLTAQDPHLTMAQVFANSGTLTGAASCTYTPQVGDGRLLRVAISDGTSVTTLSPDVAIGTTPYAVVADTVQGKAPTDFIQVNSSTAQVTQANLESVFASAAAVTELVALATGTDTRYARATTTAGIAIPTYTGTPATPTMGQLWYDSGALKYWNGSSAQTLGVSSGGIVGLTVGTGLVDGSGATGTTISSSGTIQMPSVGTAGTYMKVTTDAQGRVASGVAALVEGDIPTLMTAGHVNGGAITTGTIGGSTAVSTSGNLQTSGTITGKQIYAQDSASNYAGFKAPATVSTTYSLVLPSGLPASNGQVLSSDTLGNLSWVTPASGAVTGVTGTAPITIGGTAAAPVVGMTQASTSTSGYLSSTDWNKFNNKIDPVQMPANCSANQTLTFSSPTGTWVCSTIGGLSVAQGGTGSTDGSITGAGALNFSAGGTNQNITFTPSGTGATILNGNVGIGTSAPAQNLHIVGNNSGPMGSLIQNLSSGPGGQAEYRAKNDVNSSTVIGVNSSTFSAGGLYSANTGYLVSDSANGLNIGTTYAGSGMIRFFAGGGVPTERVRIDNNGNVGIGLTLPMASLDVYAAGTTPAGHFKNNASSTTPTLMVESVSTMTGSGALQVGTTGTPMQQISMFTVTGMTCMGGSTTASAFSCMTTNLSGIPTGPNGAFYNCNTSLSGSASGTGMMGGSTFYINGVAGASGSLSGSTVFKCMATIF